MSRDAILERMYAHSATMWLGITNDEMRKLQKFLRDIAVPQSWRAEFSLEWARRGLK